MKVLPIALAVSTSLFGAPALAGISQYSGENAYNSGSIGQSCDLSVKDTNANFDLIRAYTPKPVFCAAVYIPVCGANGVTYSNECAAHSVGISDIAEGACPASLPNANDGEASD